MAVAVLRCCELLVEEGVLFERMRRRAAMVAVGRPGSMWGRAWEERGVFVLKFVDVVFVEEERGAESVLVCRQLLSLHAERKKGRKATYQTMDFVEGAHAFRLLC
jgi:hypothetical protein